MADRRRTRAYRGGSGRTSGSGALIDTVRGALTQFTGGRGRGATRGGTRGRGGGLASQASGFLGGLLGGGGGRGRAGRRRR